jgi:hypothetical protein
LTVLPDFVVHFAFDAEPQANVIVDSANSGANHGATWVASQAGRTGVMSFNGDVGNQISVAAATNLNSMRGTIAFWIMPPFYDQTARGFVGLYVDGVPDRTHTNSRSWYCILGTGN